MLSNIATTSRHLFVDSNDGTHRSTEAEETQQSFPIQKSTKQALEAISKGIVNQSVDVRQGGNIEEMASEAVDLFADLERMRGSSDESDAEAEDEVDIREWSVRLSLRAGNSPILSVQD